MPEKRSPEELFEHLSSANERQYDHEKLAAVKAWALRVSDERRQQDLDELFLVDSAFAVNNPEQAARLKSKFLAEKKRYASEIRASGREPNIGDMYTLALQYYGLIAVVKLAETDHEEADESLRLKQEFGDLMHWFTERGVEVPKLSRTESRRRFTVDIIGSESDGPDGFRAVIHRARPLVDANIEIENEDGLVEPARLRILKETVFSLPVVLFYEIMSSLNAAGEPAGPDGYAWSEIQKQRLEQILYDDLGGKDLQRIHTAYYSALTPRVAEEAVTNEGENVV